MKHFLMQLCATIFLLTVVSFHSIGADNYTLEYNLEKGKTYNLSMVSATNMKMDIMGQEMIMDLSSEMNYQYDVLEQNDGVFDITTFIKKVKMGMSSPMPFNVDSEFPEKSSDKSIGEAFKSLADIPIDIQFTKLGKVISVKGAEKIEEKLSRISSDQVMQMFGQSFSEKAIQAMYEQVSTIFPDKPIAIDESWDVVKSMNTNGADIIIKTKLTLVQVKDNVATLDCTGTVSSPEGGTVIQIQGMDATVSSKGTQSGTILIDLKSGWIIRSELAQKSTQKIEIMGQELEQILDSKTVITPY